MAVLTVRPSDRPVVAQAIADNSFLLEEAYNQESGVVQHISAWQRDLRTRAWAYTFTQEWPVATQTHQLSYTIPLQRSASPTNTGLGDVALNYRYQLRDQRGVAIAPRISLLVPTGSANRGLGSGHVGVQVNLPISVMVAPTLVTHLNAGATRAGEMTTYNLGASAIWLARATFNVLVETVWTDVAGERAVLVNPGIRWAHNFASGLQVVPGLAYTVGVGPSGGARGAFLYLSFEHRFRPETGRH